MNTTEKDAIVIGAGLSGLTAALCLARAGRAVLVIDRLARAGGRCGTFELDGRRFTIGCNDFGARIVRDLVDLGAPVEFVSSTNILDLGGPVYRMPPGPITGLRLLRHVPSLVGAVRRIRSGGDRRLGDLFSEGHRNGLGFHFLSLLAYALGTPPQDLRADLVRADFSREYGYGHERMVVPVDGPQAIVDAMVARFGALGGELLLGTSGGPVEREGTRFVVRTSRSDYRARAVLTTQPPSRRRGRPGLSVAQILFAVPRSFPLAALSDARTLIVCPPRADRWIGALDEGHWPALQGFHLFRDCVSGAERTLTGYILAPRGVDRFDIATRTRILGMFMHGISRHIPGFSGALQYRRLLDPAEYAALHGVDSSLSYEIPEPGPAGLSGVNSVPGLFQIGNAVDPPGDHANAAMLSGMWAATRALAV